MVPRIVGVLMMSIAISASAFIEQTPPPRENEWVALGTTVHGGFGSYVALGVDIGLTALTRLHAERGQLDVTVIDGPDTPCPCIADGVMLSTGSTPGRGTLRVDAHTGPPGTFATIDIRIRDGAKGLRVTVPAAARKRLDDINREPPERRLGLVRGATPGQLYTIEERMFD